MFSKTAAAEQALLRGSCRNRRLRSRNQSSAFTFNRLKQEICWHPEEIPAISHSGKCWFQFANNLRGVRVWSEHTARSGAAPTDGASGRLQTQAEWSPERLSLSGRRGLRPQLNATTSRQVLCTGPPPPQQHCCISVFKRSARSLERCTAAEPDPPPGRRETVWRRWRPSLCSAWSFGADPPPPRVWETWAGSRQWRSRFCRYCGEAGTNGRRWKVAKHNQGPERRFTWKRWLERQRNIVPEQERMCRDRRSERQVQKKNSESSVWGCFCLKNKPATLSSQLNKVKAANPCWFVLSGWTQRWCTNKSSFCR